jgi:hypothetical protein
MYNRDDKLTSSELKRYSVAARIVKLCAKSTAREF